MKKILLLSLLGIFATACSDDDNNNTIPPDDGQNKVVLLQVDYLTNTFEGGKQLVFPAATNDDFTVSYVYHPPGDFGDIALTYQEVNMPLFAGTIIWSGTGARSFPDSIDAVTAFPTTGATVALPPNDDFRFIDYTGVDYAEPIDFEPMWNAVDNLQIVAQYRAANPSAKIYMYLYTPSVGMGNPAEWDWYVIIKN